MHRSFTVTLPADTAAHNLYDQLLLVTGAVPTDGILPKLVSQLEIQADQANLGTITISDQNNANTDGKVLLGGDVRDIGPFSRNAIHIPDYYVKGSANSQVMEVEIEAT